MPEWFFLVSGALVTSLGGVQSAMGLYSWARRSSKEVWLPEFLLGVGFVFFGGAILLRSPLAMMVSGLATLAVLVAQVRLRTPAKG
jgi:hypothetical protein